LEDNSSRLDKSRIREQCVVVIDLLGLSLSQLLGQNVRIAAEHVPSLKKLLGKVLDRFLPESESRETLEAGFHNFKVDYDACRHFGQPKHETVTSISLKKTRKHVRLALRIWDTICSQVSQDYTGIEEILNGLLKGGLDYAPREE